MNAAQQSATDKALADRDKLLRHANAAKRQRYEELFVREPMLRKFQATLNHFDIGDADRMVAYVVKSNSAWLRNTDDSIRYTALEMISHRIQRMRVRTGLPVFDDPLPGEADDVFQLCKKALGL